MEYSKHRQGFIRVVQRAVVTIVQQKGRAMTAFLHRADEYLLTRIERASHFIQRVTGLDAFDLCVGIAVIRACIFYLLWQRGSVMAVFFLAGNVLFFVPCLRYMEQIRKEVARGFRNSNTHRQRVIRILFLVTALPFGAIFYLLVPDGIIWDGYLIVAILEVYLISVTPLPPGTSSIQKFFDSLRIRSLAPAPSS